jgi:hypothetical protein
MSQILSAFLFGLALAALAACGPSSAPASPVGVGNSLDADGKRKIGRKIWQNESGGRVEGLTAWNAGEEFPSLGIGHFIWYPSNFDGPFEESWPAFVRFAESRGLRPPEIARGRHAPWPSRERFQADFNRPEMKQLRRWLADHIEVQTDFIIARSRAALPRILAAAPPDSRARIRANYQKVAATPNGTYALIDYVNFKGEGVKKSERYRGRGWGLLQVLETMRDVPAGRPAAAEFAAAAKRVLDRRIANSPPDRGESRWRAGWHNRCDTYARPL